MKKTPLPPSNEITYLEAAINYTIFHLEDGKKVLSSTTLKRHAITNEALSNFLRVHRSFLVNPAFINSIKLRGNNFIVKMSDGKEFQVARRKMGVVEQFNRSINFYELLH